MLIAARFAQGIGGAMTSAVILGMIVTMFPEPGEQARAIGVYSFVASAGGASLAASGAPSLVAQTGGYRLAFLVAALLVVAALVVVVTVVRPAAARVASPPVLVHSQEGT